MKILIPEYYSQFHCIASRCPDSCCQGWTVDVDPAAAAAYRTLPGALGNRLRQVLTDTGDGTVMEIEDGRCPMWRPDGLCRIQAELGHDALCTVCRTFPRLRHDYGDFVEQDLELSCPEAARLIFSESDRICEETLPGGEAEYDLDAMVTLLRSRDAVLSYLQEAPLPQALTVLLLYGHAVQSELDGGDMALFDPDVTPPVVPGSGDMESIFAFFADLEILTPQWAARLAAGPRSSGWDMRTLPFARYLVRRYWLQAVSDYDLICRVKFIVTACLLVNAMGDDFAETAQQFSKEIENDPDNVEALLDGAYRSPVLTDVNLLALLQKS